MEPLNVRRDGSLEIKLSDVEARAVRQVALDMLERLGEPPQADIRRLFPPAYPDDVKFQDEFATMTHDDLLQKKKDAATAVVHSIDGGKTKKQVWTATLDRATVYAWVGVVNDARLILGTRLAVTEEMDHELLPSDHPDAPAFNLYLYLGGMEELLVHYLLEHDLENKPGGD